MIGGVGHYPRTDVLALQDHRTNDRSGSELAIHLRAAILAGRIRARDPFGRFVVEGHEGDESGSERTVGDLGLGAVLVPSASATKRKIPAWFFAAPMVTAEPSRDLRPPATVADGRSTTRPNTSSLSRGTNVDLAAQRVRVRPIGREDYSEDDRFAYLDPALSPLGSPLPKGWPGVVLSATDERKQRDLFFPAGGGMLAAVNAGQHPEVGSQVFDTDGEGALDPTRVARLQSFLRVARIGPGALAWQLTRSEKDSLDGYGLVVGRGVVSAPATPPPPPASPSGSTATGGTGGAPRTATSGGTGFQVGGVTDLSTLQTPQRIDGQAGGVVRIDPATGRAVPATQVRNPPGTPGAPPATPTTLRPTPPVLGAGLVYAYSGSERGGPLQVGAQDDKHRQGFTGDGEPINTNHLNPLAPWFLDPERDGPMEFQVKDYEDPGANPYRARVHLRWDRKTQMWRWESESVFKVEVTGGDPPKHEKPRVQPPPDPPPGWYPPPFGDDGIKDPAPGLVVTNPWEFREGFVQPRAPGPSGGVAAGLDAWPFVDKGTGAPAVGGGGTGIKDGPHVATPQSDGVLVPTGEVIELDANGNEVEKRPPGGDCYPTTEDGKKVGMGPVNEAKQYASTTQAVIFGGGTYSRAYATSRGAPNLAESVAGDEGRTASKAEDKAPIVHHEAVLAAGGTQDWCRWAYADRGDGSRLATAPGAVVELPPDVTAAGYLAGAQSPSDLVATRAYPPGYSRMALGDIDLETGQIVDGVAVDGDGSSLVVVGKDSSGADLQTVALDGVAGIVRTQDLEGQTSVAAGHPGLGISDDAPVFIKADGSVNAITGGSSVVPFGGDGSLGDVTLGTGSYTDVSGVRNYLNLTLNDDAMLGCTAGRLAWIKVAGDLVLNGTSALHADGRGKRGSAGGSGGDGHNGSNGVNGDDAVGNALGFDYFASPTATAGGGGAGSGGKDGAGAFFSGAGGTPLAGVSAGGRYMGGLSSTGAIGTSGITVGGSAGAGVAGTQAGALTAADSAVLQSLADGDWKALALDAWARGASGGRGGAGGGGGCGETGSGSESGGGGGSACPQTGSDVGAGQAGVTGSSAAASGGGGGGGCGGAGGGTLIVEVRGNISIASGARISANGGPGGAAGNGGSVAGAAAGGGGGGGGSGGGGGFVLVMYCGTPTNVDIAHVTATGGAAGAGGSGGTATSGNPGGNGAAGRAGADGFVRIIRVGS